MFIPRDGRQRPQRGAARSDRLEGRQPPQRGSQGAIGENANTGGSVVEDSVGVPICGALALREDRAVERRREGSDPCMRAFGAGNTDNLDEKGHGRRAYANPVHS